MPQAQFADQITLAITGASGAPYALRLLEQLVSANYQIHVLMSSAAKVVFKTELDEPWQNTPEFFEQRFSARHGQILLPGKQDWFSVVASGSSAPKTMLICPCSMGTLASIAHGLSDNLIERAADVVLKERGKLVIVPREMPYSSLHLENMLKLSRLGATILPASPGFYHQPKSISDLVDHVVARILDHIDVKQTLFTPWGYRPEN
ncbi:UbiX family flavin prenyltransferase [Alginatibacterium sediminis]|uniref:Flavin prenyltransferase UbiX n=1 Tax=Alginatibacterium sediminis TaxID=2164068 RepID=A0A420EB21_9ALTE|nr:flavin prenyltransferase UbiX [Alginatibacterium sediminis]RKF17842.1 UbiX family flavin prenyltransferase [Alginatibacterium sediminis]